MEDRTCHVHVRVTPSLKAEIVRIATKRKMKESEVARMLLDVGLECHKDLERLGLIGVMDLVYFVKESIKEKAKGKQLKLMI